MYEIKGNNDGKATFKFKFAKYIKQGGLDVQIPQIFGSFKQKYNINVLKS